MTQAPAPHDDPVPVRTGVWSDRLALVATALGRPVPPAIGDQTQLARTVTATVDLSDRGETWFALAALSGVLPDDGTVTQVSRESEFSGPAPFFEALEALTTPEDLHRQVVVVTDTVLVDVHHTTQNDIATGIQRVVRETVRRWHTWHGCTLVAWTEGFRALRALDDAEATRVLGPDAPTTATEPSTVLVPWRSTYLVAELAIEPPRVQRQLALAKHSGQATGAIAYDLVPILAPETTAGEMPGVFANHLGALREYRRIAPISESAAVEYRGWRAAVGVASPSRVGIVPVSLASEVGTSSLKDLDRARSRFVVGDLPLVLCVGTHEPRKNHLAVLHAAEVLWREGVQFSLTFVSGRSWASDDVYRTIARLQAIGRPVETASGIDDDLLWAAYRVAHCTVFPSLEEGFGLPVAESLAVGTPVVTSDFGSMREIAPAGGTLFVDPRDDASIVDGLRRLLTDAELHARLSAEARTYEPRTWNTYADEAWAALVEG
jgi:glycosyltransferase involved in cell wall biosynthesis